MSAIIQQTIVVQNTEKHKVTKYIIKKVYGNEQKILQRGNTNEQETLKSTLHPQAQGKCRLNHFKCHLNPIRMAIFRKTNENKCCDGCHENVSQCSQFRNYCINSSKLEIRLSVIQLYHSQTHTQWSLYPATETLACPCSKFLCSSQCGNGIRQDDNSSRDEQSRKMGYIYKISFLSALRQSKTIMKTHAR